MSKVAILLCTYNGEKYLEEQLLSYTSQTFKDWDLFVSDDGSNDNTLKILKEFKQKVPNKVTIIHSTQRHFARNFLYLASEVPKTYDFYAFSDQDDIWLPNHLNKAVQNIKNVDPNIPALHCGNSIVKKAGEDVYLFCRNRSKHSNEYTSSLFICCLIAGFSHSGHSMIFNIKTMQLLTSIGTCNIFYHDRLLLEVVIGTGGFIIFEEDPTVVYRQHENNVIGAGNNKSKNFIAAKITAIKNILRYKNRKTEINQEILALNKIQQHLLPESIKIIQLIQCLHNSSLIKRVRMLYKNKINTPTLKRKVLVLLLILNYY